MAADSRDSRPVPRIPHGIRVFAIGDIHGRDDLLERALTTIDNDIKTSLSQRTIEIYLGDYIDRGPGSRRVIDLLLERRIGREVVFLKGNHEALLLDSLSEPDKLTGWFDKGGNATLLSYGVEMRGSVFEGRQKLMHALHRSLPSKHVQFLKELQAFYLCGDFFFVHAGVKPEVPLHRQRLEDLLWIRDEFIESDRDFGRYVVHGHTPVSHPDIRWNRANIDTGAYASGKLTVLRLVGSDLAILPLI